MEIPTKVAGESPEITVLLSDRFGTKYKPFHCVVCGNIVFEYNEEDVRTIIPSGRPAIDKAGKVYMCSGVIRLHGTKQLYDVLYQVTEAVFQLKNFEDLHIAVARLAEETNTATINTRCKARYYVS